MRKVLLFIIIAIFSTNAFAQNASFDLAEYGVKIEPDKRLMVVLASLEAAGPVMERLERPDAARARRAEIDLFHNPYLFALLILALTVEWALRKRFHLL